MNFFEIAQARYSCRKYDSSRKIEEEKLKRIMDAALLSPSACNGQPYHITVCQGELAKRVAKETRDVTINTFVDQAPVLLVISEKPYSKMAAVGAKLKKNDYRSIDIGILSAYITAAATAEGLGSCIIGWFDGDKIASLCSLDGTVRLIISLGYAQDAPRPKKRRPTEEMITYL